MRTVAIAAGGTGGHLFPAEALAAAVSSRGHRVVFMTDARAAGRLTDREVFVVAGAGLAGRGAVRGARALAGMARGFAQARGLLSRLQPDVLIGFGGYPSVAPVMAGRAARHRPALLLHEQNAVLGRANRMLARWADTLALSFANTTGVPAGARANVTGNPVRDGFRPSAYARPDGELRVLVVGGSLGARVFSDIVPAAIIGSGRRIRVTQQCRAEDLEGVRAAYARAGIAAELATFLDDMPARLASAHLVIARSGASTVAELAAVGRPAILVPLPTATDDHQTANARALADAGGAWLMPQTRFSAGSLADRLADLTPDALATAARASATLGRVDAAERLADLVEQAMEHAR